MCVSLHAKLINDETKFCLVKGINIEEKPKGGLPPDP